MRTNEEQVKTNYENFEQIEYKGEQISTNEGKMSHLLARRRDMS